MFIDKEKNVRFTVERTALWLITEKLGWMKNSRFLPVLGNANEYTVSIIKDTSNIGTTITDVCLTFPPML